MSDCGESLPNNTSFGLVIDKCTLDCMICSGIDAVAKMFLHVHRYIYKGLVANQ